MKTWPVLLVLGVAGVIAFVLSPADPISLVIYWIVTGVFGVGSYWLGARSST